MEKQKKSRMANFAGHETSALLSLVKEYRKIVESKATGVVTWREKEKAWQEIGAKFTARTHTIRSVQQLKEKYMGLKRTVRQRNAMRRSISIDEGRPSFPDITQEEELLLELLTPMPVSPSDIPNSANAIPNANERVTPEFDLENIDHSMMSPPKRLETSLDVANSSGSSRVSLKRPMSMPLRTDAQFVKIKKTDSSTDGERKIESVQEKILRQAHEARERRADEIHEQELNFNRLKLEEELKLFELKQENMILQNEILKMTIKKMET